MQDSAEFVAFYNDHYRLVLTVAHQRLGGLGDAEDVAAETFRIAWQRFSGGESLTLPWLYQVLRNVIGNHYRTTTRITALEEKLTINEVDTVLYESDDDGITLRSAIAELPELDRDVIRMAFWEGLTGPEIAEIVGCSATAVRIRLTRAKKKLKGVLNADGLALEGGKQDG